MLRLLREHPCNQMERAHQADGLEARAEGGVLSNDGAHHGEPFHISRQIQKG